MTITGTSALREKKRARRRTPCDSAVDAEQRDRSGGAVAAQQVADGRDRLRRPT